MLNASSTTGRSRWVVSAVVVAVASLVLAGCSSHTVSGNGSRASSASATTAACSTAPRPVFGKVSGNELLDTSGNRMVPNGMTAYGLAMKDWQNNIASDSAQIRQAASWCADYARLQVAPPNLAKDFTTYLDAVKQEVSTAEGLGLNVIISAQYQRTGGGFAPNAGTLTFWKTIAPVFAKDDRVWFELFNEPQYKDETSTLWDVWQNGSDKFVGMQQLATAIRALAPNLIIAEGPGGGSLAGLPGHELTTNDVAYAIHPYGQASETQWAATFGDLAQSVPVLVTEWSQYAAMPRRLCLPDAATSVPAFLAYLKAHDIGLGAWALVPGVLVESSADFSPSVITSGYSCSPSTAVRDSIDGQHRDDVPPSAQGAGELVRAYMTSS